MECIYLPELDFHSQTLPVPDNEAKHLKALHIKDADAVFATNGRGVLARTEIIRTGKNTFEAKIIDIHKNNGEADFRLGLALGILDNKDRFEFALEKGTELGITDFYPLVAKYSQKRIYSLERLRTKAIASMKQCRRAVLPDIHTPIGIEALIGSAGYARVILADESGCFPTPPADTADTLVIIGPEGGFASDEIELLSSSAIAWKLANRRLRAETAAIAALSLINTMC